jgi:hypothetical protein
MASCETCKYWGSKEVNPNEYGKLNSHMKMCGRFSTHHEKNERATFEGEFAWGAYLEAPYSAAPPFLVTDKNFGCTSHEFISEEVRRRWWMERIDD